MAVLGVEIAGRYTLEERLGAGGMSTVYRALDGVLERRVAVKLLAEHLSEDDGFVARFRREALAAAKLVHPNVVQVYDSGHDPDAHRHFIVMEYVARPDGRPGHAGARAAPGRATPSTSSRRPAKGSSTRTGTASSTAT